VIGRGKTENKKYDRIEKVPVKVNTGNDGRKRGQI
jgi:hypothetical protein